jgi:hypothetical protein
MSTKPTPFTGFVSREGGRQALWDNWILLNNTINEFTRQQIGFIFEQLGRFAGHRIAEDATQLGESRDASEINEALEKGVLYAIRHIEEIKADAFAPPSFRAETPRQAFALLLDYIKDYCLQAVYDYYKDGLGFCMASLSPAEDDSPPPGDPCCAYEVFEQALTEAVLAAYTGGQAAYAMAERQAAFLEALQAECDALHDQMRLTLIKAAYDFQRLCSHQAMLAEEIILLFEKTRTQLPDLTALKEILPPEMPLVGEIMAGIYETLDIKIESVRESTADFNLAGAAAVSAFTVGKKEPDEALLQATYAAVRDAWYETMVSVPRPHISDFFADCLNNEVFAAFYGYDKRIAEYSAKINKTIFNFCKETLLFEICTYEEILTHSVSRLYETGLEAIDEAVILLDDTFIALERLLRKNNIQIIRPAPHEPFNGKEHEVLMAEVLEGFAKGEIIKHVNSGYKLNGQVILRANVIAAR